MIKVPSSFLSLFLIVLVLVVVQVQSQLSRLSEWTDAELNKLDADPLQEAGKEVERIFMFYADWCSACRRYKPNFIRQISVEIPLCPAANQYEFIQINLDKAPQMARRFHISHIPAIYHQTGGEFRKIDRSDYLSNLKGFIENESFKQLPLLTLSDPSSRFGQDQDSTGKNKKGFNLQVFLSNLLKDLNISPLTLVFLLSTVFLILAFLLICAVWLYTDYKLNAHHLTDEGVRKRIKMLRKQGEWHDTDDITDQHDSDDSEDTEDNSCDSSDNDNEEEDDEEHAAVITSRKLHNVKQRNTKTRKQ